ncbi:hypothetical protein [Comamonas testosteroni]|uniref:hypothetical protein n=1 Tax=Comamonas testosteroni TaxID=285 RepID=UPI00391AADC3
MRQQLVFARRQGLSGTRDLLNSLCLALMAGARFDQLPGVKELLARVKTDRLSFDSLMREVCPLLDGRELPEPQVLSSSSGLPLTESQLPL